jgi:hypothetical protein
MAGKHRIQHIEDHELEHEHRESDRDARYKAHIAAGGRDQLHDAGIGRDPGQETQSGQEQKPHPGETRLLSRNRH